MLTEKEMTRFEDILRQDLRERQEALKVTDAYVGCEAFPWKRSPRMKVQAVKGALGGRKPQHLRLAELINLCEVFRVPIGDVINHSLRTVYAEREKRA